MRGKAIILALALSAAGAAGAQEGPKSPNESQMYCSGLFSNQALPYDTYLISGEQSRDSLVFSQGDYVYINKGSAQGVKIGDEFLVSRPVTADPMRLQWYTWQNSQMRAMGTLWSDLGRLRVVALLQNTSIAEVVKACDFMQRGDYVRPFAERPAPAFKAAGKFDRFAPPSGGKQAMVVSGKDFRQEVAEGEVIYINLGTAQGVKVGDYFRIFRYQDGARETTYVSPGIATNVYGFGSAPGRYKYSDLPRELIGEGIVLRVSANSSTALITASLREVMAGSYVEFE